MNYRQIWKIIRLLFIFSILTYISGCGTCHNGNEAGTGSGEESTLSVSISSPRKMSRYIRETRLIFRARPPAEQLPISIDGYSGMGLPVISKILGI